MNEQYLTKILLAKTKSTPKLKLTIKLEEAENVQFRQDKLEWCYFCIKYLFKYSNKYFMCAGYSTEVEMDWVPVFKKPRTYGIGI